MIRCKFKLTKEIRHAVWSGRNIELTPVYDAKDPEDQRFALATPSAKFEMTVDNPIALEQLVLGQTYYVDLTPVPPKSEVVLRDSSDGRTPDS